MTLARALPAFLVVAMACGEVDGWRSHLTPLPEADLSRHDASTRKKLEEGRARADREVASRSATAATAAAAFGELGRLYFAHDVWHAAEASLSNAATLAPGDRRWPYLLGVLAQMQGRADDAAKNFERALELAPGDGATLIRLGQVEFDRGKVASSRQRYSEALATPAVAAAANFGLGRAAAAEGDLAAAVEHFRKALAAQPRGTAAHHGLGLALRGLGRREEARQHLAQAGTEPVTFADPLVDELSSLVASASSYVKRGDLARKEGNLDQALKEYRLAVDTDPALALAQYSLGTILGERGDVAQAIVHLERATEIDPASADAFYNLGTALLRAGRTDEGIAALDRVLALDEGHLSARVRRAAARRERGQTDLARADLEAVLDRDPLHGEALTNLAILLAQTGRGADADRLLRDALARRPPADVEADVRFTRGFLLSGKGNHAAAIEEYRRAVAAKPDRADGHFNLAVSLLMRQRHPEASTAFAEAIRLQPANPRAHLGLARAHIAAGRWADARAALEEGIRRVPGDLPLKSALAEVLAGSPESAVRDGQRALELATAAYQVDRGASHAEAVAMALAELGRFEEAADFQRQLLADAEKAGAPAPLRSRLAANLSRYERKEAVRIRP